MLKQKKLLFLFSLFSIASMADTFDSYITSNRCAEDRLYLKMLDTKEAFSWDCRGAACDEVVRDIVRSLESLSIAADNVISSKKFSFKSGYAANILAKKICNYKLTNFKQATLAWYSKACNRALFRLKLIQESSEYYQDESSVHTCKIVVSNV